MPKVTIRMKARLQGTEKVFKEELGPGVVFMQDVTFTFPKDYATNPRCAIAVQDAAMKFREECMLIDLEQIKPKKKAKK